MIQRYIKNELQNVIDELEWTIDYNTSNGNYGAVYYDGGDRPQTNDTQARHMNYQVVIQHKDYEKAERLAYRAYNTVHNTVGIQTKHFDKPIFVQYIYADSDIIRVGVKDDKMIYTLNFVALIYPDCCE